MIDISRLYCREKTAGEKIRYGWRSEEKDLLKLALERRPVVVWNMTRTCNLKCLHCYSDSESKAYPGELTTHQALAVVKDLAEFKIPALLLSGGEPLLRKDIFVIVHEAKRLGLRVTLSSNGTLITRSMAERIKEAGFIYVGLSLDGMGDVHDQFRGVKGSFEKTLAAIRHCKDVGQKVGLRLTLTRHTLQNLSEILELMVREGIDRACFYHLVFTGRGRFLKEESLSKVEMREAMDLILKTAKTFHLSGLHKEVLTVGNPGDGVYVYLKLLQDGDHEKAKEAFELVSHNGGGLFGSGVGLGRIDYYGNVHPDQFWMDESLGNVKDRPFSQIWQDLENPLMKGLKSRLSLLKGRCSTCRWKEQCGGGLRTRAHLAYDDPWAEDPGCYLTDREIAAEAD